MRSTGRSGERLNARPDQGLAPLPLGDKMKHRIRAAGIIIKGNKILLVRHVDPKTQYEWWVPPGGGLEDVDSSIIDCLIRETYEETGYHVEVDSKLIFLREFMDIENSTLNIELFFNASVKSGELTIKNIQGNGPDEYFIKEVKWLSLLEIQDIDVFPEELKDNFGIGMKKLYLGRQQG